MHFSWFDVLAVPILGQGILSLRDGIRYLNFCRESQATPSVQLTYTPKAAVLAPCKGTDEGLRRNLNLLAYLDYPHYELIFIVESSSDPAYALLEEFCLTHPQHARFVVAGKADGMGQKVHNLMYGVQAVSQEVEVLAFLDSDVLVTSDWLRRLVAPLEDTEVGASTGFRWYMVEGGLATIFRSAWNGSIATTFGSHRRNFAWGGSMAIRRSDFNAFQVVHYWQGAVSDDYALTEAVKKSGKYIQFVPSCLVASPGKLSFAELVEFTTRQIIITRVYSSTLWKVALGWYVFYTLVFFGFLWSGLVWGLQKEVALAQVLVGFMVVLSFAKSALTLKAIGEVLGKSAVGSWPARLVYCLIGPFVAVLYACNTVIAGITRQIVWRGIRYELRSPHETVILETKSETLL